MGRAAVDLYGEQVGARLEDVTSFAKYLGGSPANTGVGASRLGLKVAMLTRVGDEHNGRFVRETLAAEGVDVSHVKTDPAKLTALVFLGLKDRQTFPLVFYRHDCADMAIAGEDFHARFIGSARRCSFRGRISPRIELQRRASKPWQRRRKRTSNSSSTSTTGPCSGAWPRPAAARTAS